MRRFGILLLLSVVILQMAAPAYSQLPSPKCPEGVGAVAGDEPQYLQKANKAWLFVCGRKKNSFGRDVFSEFNLYYLPAPDKKPVKVPFEATAVDDYGIDKTATGLNLLEMALIDNEWLPLFKRAVRCTAQGVCKIGRVTCAKAKLKQKPQSAKPLIDVYRKEAAKRSSTGQATDQAEIAIVLAAALGGEKEAIEAFDQNPGFRLDGAASEHYEYGKRLLKRLKRMKCKL